MKIQNAAAVVLAAWSAGAMAQIPVIDRAAVQQITKTNEILETHTPHLIAIRELARDALASIGVTNGPEASSLRNAIKEYTKAHEPVREAKLPDGSEGLEIPEFEDVEAARKWAIKKLFVSKGEDEETRRDTVARREAYTLAVAFDAFAYASAARHREELGAKIANALMKAVASTATVREDTRAGVWSAAASMTIARTSARIHAMQLELVALDRISLSPAQLDERTLEALGEEEGE